MVPTPMPGLGSAKGEVAGVHFFIQDKTGQSIAVESVDGKLVVTDAPLGVMTNAPTYDWHMTNLNNYVNLSVKDTDPEKLGSVTLTAPGLSACTGCQGTSRRPRASSAPPSSASRPRRTPMPRTPCSAPSIS